MSTLTVTPPAVQDAESLFQAQQWADAAHAFARLVETEPGNGRAWYRLGMARLSAGDTPGAIQALHQAVTIGQNPVVMFNLACAYARGGDTEAAFTWLTNAVEAGFGQAGQMDIDPDLAALKGDPRFAALRAQADRLTKPGLYNATYHQFDFWLGEWEVTSQGQFVGANSIQGFSDGCGLLENYTQVDGYTGKSINYYDAVLGKWRQTWADSAGHMCEFIGAYSDRAMRLEGHWHRRDGSTGLSRMTFFHIDDDHVRQYAEQSNDNGQTWNAAYDFLYTRKL